VNVLRAFSPAAGSKCAGKPVREGTGEKRTRKGDDPFLFSPAQPARPHRPSVPPSRAPLPSPPPPSPLSTVAFNEGKKALTTAGGERSAFPPE